MTFETSDGPDHINQIYKEYSINNNIVCKYCHSQLRQEGLVLPLCTPCRELYKRKIIRREVGKYVKNTASDRRRIKDDLEKARYFQLNAELLD